MQKDFAKFKRSRANRNITLKEPEIGRIFQEKLWPMETDKEK